ncbi:Uncharacterized protein GBIM_17410 [Gryllus bimaculatus]|nr:Uncharacterized protein GBIM_17410 [Gryllus bimaculatus]
MICSNEQECDDGSRRRGKKMREPTSSDTNSTCIGRGSNPWANRGKVKTSLENPTLYHVIQKQRNQVRQYLCETRQPGGSAGSGGGGGGGGGGSGAGAALGARLSELQSELGQAQSAPPTMLRRAPSSASATAPSPDAAMSPSLSSVTTSASEVHMFEAAKGEYVWR